MMTEFMAERAEKRSKRSNLLADCRPHPHANQLGLGIVIAEKLGSPSAPVRADGSRARGYG
jgi:hypothetical protein